jgi:hypothetical protein
MRIRELQGERVTMIDVSFPAGDELDALKEIRRYLKATGLTLYSLYLGVDPHVEDNNLYTGVVAL